MRIETDEIRDNLKYLALLARDYPSQAAAASEIISNQALLKLPKGTEHFMSDLHGENEAFVHILNSASGVIREKVDAVLGGTMPEAARAELATLIYYPTEKLPQLKARCTTEDALEQWYTQTLLQLIDICRLVSSKHTRDHVRGCLPSSCGYILDELLHAHFEDHDKDLYYGQIVGSIIENGRADRFIVRLCELIKHLAVDKLHIVGDLFDRGPRPDIILDLLMRHHNVDIQWGNHDVVWMGAAAGSPICICTVLKTTLAYHNHGMLEDCYGINLRHLQRMAEQFYGEDDLSIWMPHTDAARGPYTQGMLHHTVRTRTRFFMKKGLGTFFVYRKFCGRTTRNGKRAKAGYHYDSGILPFALRNQVRFVRTWSSPYMARLGVVAAYVRTGSLYTSDKV